MQAYGTKTGESVHAMFVMFVCSQQQGQSRYEQLHFINNSKQILTGKTWFSMKPCYHMQLEYIMKILLVYDSKFGNTEQIAIAMQHAIAQDHTVCTIRPEQCTADMIRAMDVLVVGSPTHNGKPTEAIMRFLHHAASQRSFRRIQTLAFDTRTSPQKINARILRFLTFLTGYAAPKIGKRLRRMGSIPVAAPAGFFVAHTKGPVCPLESERASQWIRNALSCAHQP